VIPQPRTLKAYLRRSGETQRSLARRAGCDQSMISMLKTGKRIASGPLALKLHRLTGVPLEALLTLQRQRPPDDDHSDAHDDDARPADTLADGSLPLEGRRQPLRAATLPRVSRRPDRLRDHGAA
jgi:transcriptional regulator with XRE-family HTH domain